MDVPWVFNCANVCLCALPSGDPDHHGNDQDLFPAPLFLRLTSLVALTWPKVWGDGRTELRGQLSCCFGGERMK